jgi:hypothetical protein
MGSSIRFFAGEMLLVLMGGHFRAEEALARVQQVVSLTVRYQRERKEF